MESPAFFHLGENPRQQETADEVSQCSQTPFHPDKHMQNELCSPLCVCLGDRQIDMYMCVFMYVCMSSLCSGLTSHTRYE